MRAASGFLVVALMIASSSHSLAYLPSSSTTSFVNDPASECRRGVISGRRLAALHGELATRQSSQGSTEAFVAAFVAANKDAFGVEDVELELIDSVLIRNNKFESFSFRQTMEELPVVHGAVNILVFLGSPDKITHVGMSLVQPPSGGFPTETLDAEDAVNTVVNHDDWNYLDTFDSHTTAEHVVFEAKDMKVYRTWRFKGFDEDESYLFYVDAASGDIVGVENQISAYSGKVKVKGDVELCCHPGRADWPACCQSSSPACCCNESDPGFPCVDECCGNPGNPVFVAMQPIFNVEVTLTSDSCPSSESDWQPERLTDEDGEYDFAQCTGSNCTGNKASVRLQNDRIRIWCGAPYIAMPSLIESCANAVDPIAEIEFDFTSHGSCSGYVATSYHHVSTALDWLDELQPGYSFFETPMDVVLDHHEGDAESSAPGFGVTSIRLGLEQGDFGATATIIGHEIGHVIHDVLHMKVNSSFGFNLGEDLPDVLPLLLWDTPCRGYNAQYSVVNGCDADWDPPVNARYGGFSAPFGTGKDKLLAEAFWDLRTAMLRCSNDSDVSCTSHSGCNVGPCISNQCSDQRTCLDDEDCKLGPCVDRATEELFVDMLINLRNRSFSYDDILPLLIALDDDDNNLCSEPRTPHYDQLHDAFVVQHGFPDPFPVNDGSIAVQWEGPISEPDYEDCGQNCDFTIDYGFTPPIVRLITTEKGGLDVDIWRVGRMLEGEPADLGVVVSNWTEPNRTIIVEFGTVPQTIECRNAHFLSISDPVGDVSPASIVLDLKGSVVGLVLAQGKTDGTSGRISGDVAGGIAGLVGTAIGTSTSGSGDIAAQVLHVSQLETLPLGSRMILGKLTDAIEIAQASAGDIRIDGDLSGKLNIGGNMTGNITADRDISGDITIDGDFTGDLAADWDANGDGLITGNVTMSGTFSGNICDAYIAANGDLPTHLAGLNLRCDAPDCTDNLCRLRPPLKLKALPHSAPKNRALSINPRSTYGEEVALKIELVSMQRCTGDYDFACTTNADCTGMGTCGQHPDVSDSEETWWVGEPWDPSCQFENGNSNGNPCTEAYYLARAVDDPVTREWTEAVVHVADCEIVPAAKYTIQATANGTDFTEIEEFETTPKPSDDDWGDITGGNTADGWLPPNGIANTLDIVAVVQSISNPDSAPHPTWTDVYGSIGGAPNGKVNTQDVLVISMAVNGHLAFGKTIAQLSPSECPADGAPGELGMGDPISLTLSGSDEFLDPEEWLYVDVFTAAVDELGAYEVALEVSGGTSGSLVLADILVDDERTDFVFETDTTIIAKNVNQGRVGVVREGGGTEVTGTKYLATFVYQPESGASGVFDIAIKDDGATFLNDGNGILLAVTLGSAEVVGVGIDCWETWHCNDNNACTTDACTDYECVFTNATQGTACNDGLFCTATDTCNGSGVCTGTGNPCPPVTHWCNEFQDQCAEVGQGEES